MWIGLGFWVQTPMVLIHKKGGDGHQAKKVGVYIPITKISD